MVSIKRLYKLFGIIKATLKQRHYKHITYYFRSCRKSDIILVSFCAFPGGCKPSRYNYINTLKNMNVNRLFLLDNHGYNKTGSYFLGENGNYYLLDEIPELIKSIKEKNNIKKTVMLGSSKGGTSAILYGILCNADYVIAGAPQYYLGNYLSSPDVEKAIFEGIGGGTSQKTIDYLNDLLPSVIRNSADSFNKPIIYLNYSPYEHTYPEHISMMLCDLKKSGFTVITNDNYTYKNHKDVGVFFRDYLKTTCREIISAENEAIKNI